MFSTLPKNLNGRDFIVGDLHGYYYELASLMAFVNFDHSVDRLFLVGDLVDRGPNSIECLRLLNLPYVYAVKGNHEEMFSLAITGPSPAATMAMRRIHVMNGGDWMWDDNGWGWHEGGWHPDLDPEEIKVLARKAKDLPHVITVEDSFSVMHAEPPAKTTHPNRDLLNYSQGSWMTSECLDGATTLWGRRWFLEFYARDPATVKFHSVPYSSLIDTLYVGHTPVKQPLRLGFLVNLDTGMGKKEGYLTMHCHTTGETYSLKDGGVVPNYIHIYEPN